MHPTVLQEIAAGAREGQRRQAGLHDLAQLQLVAADRAKQPVVVALVRR